MKTTPRTMMVIVSILTALAFLGSALTCEAVPKKKAKKKTGGSNPSQLVERADYTQ